MPLFKYRVYLSHLQRLRNFCDTSVSFPKKSYFMNTLEKNTPNFITKLRSMETLTNEDWKEVSTYLAEQPQRERDNIILQTCLMLRRADAAIPYLKQRMEGKEFDFKLMSSCIKLYAHLKRPFSESEKQEVCRIYDELKKHCTILDPVTAQKCIKILSKTERWEECTELLDIINFTSAPGKTEYSTMVAAAFQHGKFDMGTKYISKMFPKIPLPSVYLDYLEYCKKVYQDPKALMEQLEQIMHFWATVCYIPEHSMLKEYTKVFKDLGLEVSDTNIKPNGTCTACKGKLSDVTITQEEFEMLANTLAEYFVVGKDIYRNSNPKELTRYKKFVKETKPYDVVIDGLNVIYTGGKMRNMNFGYKKLAQCVKYFIEQQKKVLVIGRSHMEHGKGSSLEYIKKNAYLFLVDNVSCDDQFVLHAALSSGINAKFMTNDLLTGQLARIKDMHLKNVFLRWKLSHQYMHSMKDKETLDIQEPISYKPFPQKHGNAWHIPYVSQDPEQSLQNLKCVPDQWLCVNKRTRRDSLPILHHGNKDTLQTNK